MSKIIYAEYDRDPRSSLYLLKEILNSQSPEPSSTGRASTSIDLPNPGEVQSRTMKVIDDGDPTADDFFVISPAVHFGRLDDSQTLIVNVRELMSLPSAEIVGFDFESAPQAFIPVIKRDDRSGGAWPRVDYTDIISGPTEALMFTFKFPRDVTVKYKFHFKVSVKNRNGKTTTFLIDPQVGNDPPSP